MIVCLYLFLSFPMCSFSLKRRERSDSPLFPIGPLIVDERQTVNALF